MPKRPWKEGKVVVYLPIDVLEALNLEAAQLYKSVGVYLRDFHIERLQRGDVTQPVDHPSASTATAAVAGPRSSRSGFKGVYVYGRRWEAVAYVNRRRRRLSVHDTAEDAARAYDAHLIEQAGDPRAAVNFSPANAPAAAEPGTAFVEQFASQGKLSDVEWQRWQQSSGGAAAVAAGPIPVRPDGVPMIDSSTPLVDRPGKPLHRRDSSLSLPVPTPITDPDADPNRPDEDPEHVH